jgi:hypothetical protein
MAHYAYLDENNIVTQVIVGKDEDDIVLDENGNQIDWEIYYGAKKTSYNTLGGVHLLGGTPYRKNYAGIGYTYDESRDAFIPSRAFLTFAVNASSLFCSSSLRYEPPPVHFLRTEPVVDRNEFHEDIFTP